MTDSSRDPAPIVDAELVRTLAAANGLSLTTERAADLVSALQAILDADAQLTALDLGALPAAGLPWDTAQARQAAHAQ